MVFCWHFVLTSNKVLNSKIPHNSYYIDAIKAYAHPFLWLEKGHIQMWLGAVDRHLGLHPVPIHSLLLSPHASVTLSPLPLCFSPAFGRKWSQSSSRITWNNLKWGAPFSLSPPPPASLRPRPADLLPLSIVCPVDCVLPARGVEGSLCLHRPTLNCVYCVCVLQQVALKYPFGPLTVFTTRKERFFMWGEKEERV